jgi:hypothetical protein
MVIEVMEAGSTGHVACTFSSLLSKSWKQSAHHVSNKPLTAAFGTTTKAHYDLR